MLKVGLLNISFIALTFASLLYFYWLIGKNNRFLVVAILWLILQAFLAYSGVFLQVEVIPPIIIIFVALITSVFIVLGLTKFGRTFRENINLEKLHYLHILRIFIEIIFLHGLYELGYIAKHVTYEGNNFDIIPAVTAPIIALTVFRWKKLPESVALFWNFAGIAILAFTVSQAVLSSPLPFQQFSFEQPTIAILFFPFAWLPTFLVPLVFLAHFIAIKKILKQKTV